MALVYLLRTADGRRFKIGKADDVHKRIPLIGGAARFDLPNSLCVPMPDGGCAGRLERTLHFLFKGSRCAPVNDGFDGTTEYFSIDCWHRVETFLNTNTDLHASNVEPLPAAPVRPQPEVRQMGNARTSSTSKDTRHDGVKRSEHRERVLITPQERFQIEATAAIRDNERALRLLERFVGLLLERGGEVGRWSCIPEVWQLFVRNLNQTVNSALREEDKSNAGPRSITFHLPYSRHHLFEIGATNAPSVYSYYTEDIRWKLGAGNVEHTFFVDRVLQPIAEQSSVMTSILDRIPIVSPPAHRSIQTEAARHRERLLSLLDSTMPRDYERLSQGRKPRRGRDFLMLHAKAASTEGVRSFSWWKSASVSA